MDPAFATVPAGIAAIFIAAGWLKLTRPERTVMALGDFRAPAVFRNKITAILLALGEIGLGVGLGLTHGWAFTTVAILAAGTCAVFVFLTARALIRGERFDCGCFGAVQSPISGALVVRNVLLLMGAIGTSAMGFAGFTGVMQAFATYSPADAAGGAVGVFFVALAIAFVLSTRRTTIETTSDLPEATLKGAALPDLYFASHQGDAVRLLDMLDRAHLVVMVRPGCQACNALLQDTDTLRGDLPRAIGILLVVSGDQERFASEHPELAAISLFGGWNLTSYLRVSTFPAAVLVGADRRLLAEPVAGPTAILGLAQQASRLS